MKLFILTYLTLLIGICLSAQKDPNQWEADIIVRHPSGLTDTVTIGAALNGALGYQPDLDIIDTNFTTPISIRSHDPEVVLEFGTCHANMRKDIRAFSETLTFSFYVKSDSFPYDWVVDPINNVSLIIDSSLISFNNSKWKLERSELFSLNGYLYLFDLDELWIKNSLGMNPMIENNNNHITLIHQTNFLMDYYQNSCDGLGSHVLKFELVVKFSLNTGIKDIDNSTVIIKNRNTEKTIYVNFLSPQSGNYQIIDLSGRTLLNENFINSQELILPYQLNNGMYILIINSKSKSYSHKFIVH